MNLTPRRPLFSRRPESNLYRMFFYVILALGGIWLILQLRGGLIKSPFEPAPAPTRTSTSYEMEGDAQFTAGSIDKSIAAYQEAVRVDPKNSKAWAELARVQTYSSSLLTTDAERIARLEEALKSAKKATELASEDSTAHAVLAFTLDWNADPSLFNDDHVQQNLVLADQEAVRALQLDPTNTRAEAYYAEILVDEQKWTQAGQYIKQAVDADPSLMDVHRVYAYFLETGGEYNLAIQEYDKAIAITPKLTFLYLRAGANYRTLGFKSPNEENQKQLFDSSLTYFAKAASINAELQVKDPVPYLSIAKTYSQEGEYFIAARNVQKALVFQPGNPDFYGQLGIIYFKSRNYEGSIPALACAINGCAGEELVQRPRIGRLRRTGPGGDGGGAAADTGLGGLLPGVLLGAGGARPARQDVLPGSGAGDLAGPGERIREGPAGYHVEYHGGAVGMLAERGDHVAGRADVCGADAGGGFYFDAVPDIDAVRGADGDAVGELSAVSDQRSAFGQKRFALPCGMLPTVRRIQSVAPTLGRGFRCESVIRL